MENYNTNRNRNKKQKNAIMFYHSFQPTAFFMLATNCLCWLFEG